MGLTDLPCVTRLGLIADIIRFSPQKMKFPMANYKKKLEDTFGKILRILEQESQ